MLPGWVYGRATEFEELASALDADKPILVVGESGIGKTTLLRAVANAADRPVFEGGALSTLTWMEYLAFERALGHGVGNGDPAQVAIEVETEVGAGTLLLDDLQWAAPHTIEAVTLLAGRVGLLAAIRLGTTEATAALDRLASEGFQVIDLIGLGAIDARALLAEIAPAMPDAVADGLTHRTGGNPLLLRELARTGEASPSLRLAMAARLRGLTPAVRKAFELIALAGRPISVEGIGGELVAGLVSVGLVTPVGDGLVELHNALLGEVAIELMEADEARALHAALAELIEDDAESARHHARAGNSREAYIAAMRASDATDRPGERAAHLALAASCVDGPESIALRLEAARHLLVSQDWMLLNEVLAPLATAEPEIRAEAALLRARGAWGAGFPEILRSALDEGLALVGGTKSDTEVRLLVDRCRVPIFMDGDRAEGLRSTTEALRMAVECHIEVPRAEYFHGTAAFVDGQTDLAVEHLTHAIREARETGDLSVEMPAANNLLMLEESQGDPARARQLGQEYADYAADLGLMVWNRSFQAAVNNLDFHAGRYARMLIANEELLSLPLEARSRESLLEIQCLGLIDTGRIEEALRRLEEVEERPDDWTLTRQVTWVRIQAALWGGRPKLALDLCDTLLPGPSGDANVAFVHVAAAWASYDLGLVPSKPPVIDIPGMISAVPLEVEAIGHLAAARYEQAVSAFDGARQLWTGYHKRGELRCHWGAGEAARWAGRDDAVERLLAGEAIAIEHGMAPLLARIHKSLRALGVQRSAPRVRSGIALLTGRETEVLGLVGDGLTNAEIAARLGVSRHTVVRQITTASAKLGATSRTHAASMLVVAS